MAKALKEDVCWMPGSWRECAEGELLAGSSHATALPGDEEGKGHPLQTHTLREYEKHLNDLKKENFSLKLRIYFLEEHLQQKYEESSDDVYRRNIELKVEVESLKKELQGIRPFLDKAWSGEENPTNQNEAELRRQYAERQQETEHVQELLENKIQLLQEEVRLAKNEADRMGALAEAEKKSAAELTKTLQEYTEEMKEAQILQNSYCVTLADKDKMLQQLTQVLDAKEAVIQHLTEEKQSLQEGQIRSLEVRVQELTGSLQQKEHEAQLLQDELNHQKLTAQQEIQNLTDTQHRCQNQYEMAADQYVSELQTAELHVQTMQNRIMESQAANKILQEKLQGMDIELKSVRGTSEKQERTIQSLNEALKNKENEIEELYHVMEEQDKMAAELREMLHTTKAQHLQRPEDSSFKQQAELLAIQDTLICTQLELQKRQRALRQKDQQLSDAKRLQQLLEADIQDVQLQKETTWKHNQDLHAALHDLQFELQDKRLQMQSLEQVKSSEIMVLENNIQHLKEMMCQKEQLLQDHANHLQDQQNLGKNPEMSDTILNKLRLRIRDRDLALERAVDEKFYALEDKEKDLKHLQLMMREKDQELEKLRGILSSNEETINSLDSLLKLKDQELDQASRRYRRLQWLGQQVQEKYNSSLKERERIILQLHSLQQEQSKEHLELMAALITKASLGSTAVTDELQLCLQRKEKMLQDAVRYQHQQAAEYEQEIQVLIKSLATRDQQMDIQIDCSQTTVSSKNVDPTRDLEKTLALEKELANASDELQLMSRKERETRLELLALQCTVGKQNEELQAQAADVESLTRNIHIKEELIKDLQMQLVNPEEIPNMGRLVQEVLVFQEKLSTVELHAQERSQNRGQELLLNLEQLVEEKKKLNEALEAEKHLYSNLVTSLMKPASCERGVALQVELEAVQGLRGRLEEALNKTLEHLSRLEADYVASNHLGGPSAGNKGADRGSEFTESTEEDPADVGKTESTSSQQNTIDSSGTVPGSEEAALRLPQNSLGKGGNPKKEQPQVREGNRETDDESRAPKEESWNPAGYPNSAEPRSLCWDENMKDQMKDAKSGWWERETQKTKDCKEEDGIMDDRGQRSEIRKSHEKMSHADPNLSQEEMLKNCHEGAEEMNPESVLGTSKDLEGLKSVPMKRSALGVQRREEAAKRHCMRPQSLDLGALLCQSAGKEEAKLPSSASQVDFDPEHTRLEQHVKLSLREQTERLCSELVHCRQQNRELQDKLVVSEATVHAQGDQLKHFQLMLSEPLVTQDSKEVQVGLQDLGYETCGRSENEADREEASSPEFNEEEDFLTDDKITENLNPRYKFCGSAVSNFSKIMPIKCKLGSHKELMDWDISEDIPFLQQHIRELRRKLYRSEQVIHNLQSPLHVPTASRDRHTGMDELQGMKGSVTFEGSPVHSITDEDEGWQSDSLGPFSHSEKDLQKLIKRVSMLETQLQKPRQDGMPSNQLTSSTWPGRYDSLIQVQARELSYLRQKLREGRGICHTLSQHLGDTIKSFEELLRANDIDYYMGQSFREQLAKGSQLAERLIKKLNRREHSDVDEKSGHELLALRLSKELQQKDKIIEDLQAKLQAPSMTPSSSRAISESDQSDRTSFVSDDQVSTNDDLDVCSDVDTGSEYTRYEQESIRNSTHSASDLISSSVAFTSKPSSAIISHELQTQSSSHTSPPSSQSHPTDASCANVASSHPYPMDTSSVSIPSSHPHPTDTSCTSAPSTHHSMDISQPPKGLHFSPLPTSVTGAPVSSFLPFLDPRCSGAGGHWTLAEVQQELQMLQRQLGESFPLTTPAVKAGSGSGNFPEASACFPSSHLDATTFQHLSHHVPQQIPVHNSSPYFLQRADPTLPVSCEMPLPRANILGDASSASSGYYTATKLTGGGISGRDLFEEHLNEIKSLRQRLEDSISTNSRLRRQLEDRLKVTANGNGPPTNIYIQGLESLPQLSSENRALREENLNLQLQLSQLSRDHCRELGQLKEGLLSARSRLKNTEMELEQLREESRKLQEDEKKQKEEILHLRGEHLSDQERSNRLQHKVTLLSQQLNEDQQLLQSLQSELQVYERLYGTSKLVLSGFSGETYHSLPSNFNFNELLSEVRHLRVQLEHSIQVNSSLRQHLEEQLEKKYSTRPPPINIFAPSDSSNLKPPFQDAIPSPPVRDVGMQLPFCTNGSFLAPENAVFHETQDAENCWNDSGIQSSSMLEDDSPDGSFANKNGHHVIGHIDDYRSLKQQILEGNALISKLESLMQSSLNIPFLEIHGTQALDYGSIRQLFCISSTLHQILQESTSLLAMFWRAALPNAQEEEETQSMKEEILKLRSKLAEQGNILQTTVEHLNTTNLLRENMEQFIVGQLTKTHDVLRKARTNLEKNNYKISSGKPHLFNGKGEIHERSLKHQSQMTPLFQEPLRKRNSLKSQKRREEWSSPCFI